PDCPDVRLGVPDHVSEPSGAYLLHKARGEFERGIARVGQQFRVLPYGGMYLVAVTCENDLPDATHERRDLSQAVDEVNESLQSDQFLRRPVLPPTLCCITSLGMSTKHVNPPACRPAALESSPKPIIPTAARGGKKLWPGSPR